MLKSIILNCEMGRARARTIYFPMWPGLAQDFSARVELELYCYLNEPIPNRQYPLRIGSFCDDPFFFFYYYLFLFFIQNVKRVMAMAQLRVAQPT
jgi:hypothetical protein